MPALQRDLTIEQGTTWAHSFGVTINSAPIGAGWTVRSQIRERHSAVAVLHEWSTVAGNAAVVAGAVQLTVPAAVSSAWSWAWGVYDVEVTSPVGDVYRVASGHVAVSPEVTR